MGKCPSNIQYKKAWSASLREDNDTAIVCPSKGMCVTYTHELVVNASYTITLQLEPTLT